MGSQLFMPKTNEAIEAVRDFYFANSFGGNTFWFGLDKAASETNLQWIDGSGEKHKTETKNHYHYPVKYFLKLVVLIN